MSDPCWGEKRRPQTARERFIAELLARYVREQDRTPSYSARAAIEWAAGIMYDEQQRQYQATNRAIKLAQKGRR